MNLSGLPYRITLLLLALISVGTGIMLVLILTDGPPVRYPVQPFPLERTEYRPGEDVLFSFEVCATRNVIYLFTQRLKSLDSGLLYQLPGSSVKQDEGCRRVVSIPKHIPEDLPPGRYQFEFLVSVDGRFRHFYLPLVSAPFTVRPADRPTGG